MWHLQRTTEGWLDSLYRLPDSASVKATGGYEVFREVKAINPRIFTIHRMVRQELEIYEGTRNSGWFDWETAKGLARMWFNAFVDGTFVEKIAPYTNAVSWHNEVWADSFTQVEIEERIKSHEAAVYIWDSEFRPRFSNNIRLIIGEAAPGNGMARRIGELALSTDNIVGYHPYDWWINGERHPDPTFRRMTAHRYDVLEQAWGLRPLWAFTEAGPLQAATNGWRSKECLNGDVNKYVEAVRIWIREVAQTNAYKEGRLHGFNLFTTFAPKDPQWGSFHTGQPEMNMLADMIREEWRPGTYYGPEPPDDPNPGNDDELRQMAWEVTVNKQVTGNGGLRLNPSAGIQRQINIDNQKGLSLQVVTDETKVGPWTVQAAESLTGAVPRRVYVWEPGKPIWHFEET